MKWIFSSKKKRKRGIMEYHMVFRRFKLLDFPKEKKKQCILPIDLYKEAVSFGSGKSGEAGFSQITPKPFSG
jgi:hypothetical protein